MFHLRAGGRGSQRKQRDNIGLCQSRKKSHRIHIYFRREKGQQNRKTEGLKKSVIFLVIRERSFNELLQILSTTRGEGIPPIPLFFCKYFVCKGGRSKILPQPNNPNLETDLLDEDLVDNRPQERQGKGGNFAKMDGKLPVIVLVQPARLERMGCF